MHFFSLPSKMKKCGLMLLWVGITHLYWLPVFGQDPHFSQYYATPLYLNPSLASLEKTIYIGLNYRNQWRSIGFPQKTGQFSAILPVQLRNHNAPLGSIGIAAFNDVLGENNNFRTTGAMLALSRAIVSNTAHQVAISLQAGVTDKRLDASQLQWGSQYDPFMGFNANLTPAIDQLINQKLYPVLNAGAIWHYNHGQAEEKTDWSLFAGIAASNINQPDESLIEGQTNRLPTLYKIHGGAAWQLSPKISLSPNILWMRQNEVNQLNGGAYLNYHLTTNYQGKNVPLQLIIGSWYRLGDSFILSAGAAFRSYNFGFSYDVNVSTLRYGTQGRGAFEFSVAYRFSKAGNTIRRYSTPLM